MKVDRKTKDVPREVVDMSELLIYKFGVNLRPSGTLDMIKYLIGKDLDTEWDLIDPTMIMNGQFESYMIEQYQKFLKDSEIELDELADAVMKVGDYSRTEKTKMNRIGLDKITWAICLAFHKINNK